MIGEGIATATCLGILPGVSGYQTGGVSGIDNLSYPPHCTEGEVVGLNPDTGKFFFAYLHLKGGFFHSRKLSY